MLEGVAVAGQTTEVVLEQNVVEIGRVSHTWTKDTERFATRLSGPLVEAGVAMLSVRAKPVVGESTLADNAVDLRGVAEPRILKIAAYDPRPSWTSAFVRRVLEADPMFEVSTIVEASKGLDVRSGHPPARMTAEALEPYDLVVIGAPEEVTASESAALSAFARERGGAVLLLPDRRPSGAYLGLVGASGFDEVLLDKAVELEGRTASRLRGSEFAVPKGTDTASAVATIRQGDISRPVVISVPAGRGQIIFSGALDAWRFRGTDDGGYERFWRQLVALGAIAAPRRLELSLHPGLATPGLPITIRAEIRKTEVGRQGADRQTFPPISASVIAESGSASAVRLWPTSDAGVYEGRFVAATAGRYDVRVSLDARVTADAPLVIEQCANAPRPRRRRPAAPRKDDGWCGGDHRRSGAAPCLARIDAETCQRYVVPRHAIAMVGRGICGAPLCRVGGAPPAGGSVIDTYLTYLRDVRRVAANTVESYARDLASLAAFAEKRGVGVEALERRDLEAFVRSQMTAGLSPRSVARAVACVRGFYRFVALERKADTSPADDLRAPRAWTTLPKFLSLDDVDRLVAQPDPSTPRGLRDKALIELLYATGMRVSELVGLKPGDLHLDDGYLTCIGKGDKQRIVPLGQEAADWVRRYMRDGRGTLAGGATPWLFVNARDGGPLSRVGFWKILKEYGREGWDHPDAQSAHAAALVRDAPARAGRRSPRDSAHARTRRSFDDADLHARARGPAARGVRSVPPAEVTLR